MRNFEVNKGKHLLRASIGALLTTSVLMGCTLNTKPNSQAAANSDEYCFNGGKSTDYTCDPALAQQQAPLHTPATDDAWMQDKLSEIKKWLAQEKTAVLTGQPTTPTAAGANEHANSVSENADSVTESAQTFLTSVSNTASNNSSSQLTAAKIEKVLALSQQGKHQAALKAINAHISAYPDNAAAELTKGLILNNMGDKQAAKAIFTKLTQSHPERPEAFNNLAVIYAEEGDYPQAIDTLQSAFQTHPSYAQVHSNLKDLYASLASQAYNRALDLGSENAGPSLAMINQLPADQAQPTSNYVVAASNTVAKPVAATQVKPLAVTETTSKPGSSSSQQTTPKPVAVKPVTATPTTPTEIEVVDLNAKPVAHSANQPAPAEPVIAVVDTPNKRPVAAPEKVIKKPVAPVVTLATTPATVPNVQAQPEVAVTSAAKQINSASLQGVIAAELQAWAKAWRSKNPNDYIAAYTPSYRPNAKLSHSAWVEQRKQRLTKPKFINVQLANIQVEILRENLAEVKFEQRYQSDTYRDAVKKRVLMVSTDKGWRISLEKTLGVLPK